MTMSLVPIRQTTGTPPIVSVFRPGDVQSDILDTIQSLQAFARTCYLLRKALDQAQAHKAMLAKELGRAVKSAWEQFGGRFAPEAWRPVDAALAALRSGRFCDEDLELMVAWCEQTRRQFLGHDDAQARKAQELAAAKGRIEDLEFALRRVIMDQPGAPGARSQMDLPGVKVESGGVWDSKVRRTVVEVFAEEVKTTKEKAAAPEADGDARAAAEAQAAADEALVAALQAMGFADASLPDEDLQGLEEDVEVEEAEVVDAQAELPIDVVEAEVSAAETHEALQGPKTPPKKAKKGKAA